ncbi:MAG: hypothetical protein OHK0045_04520 [Raineya sp.]
MLKKWILLTNCLLGTFTITAQEATEYEIATDRPSVSFSAATVPKNILIVETGYLQYNQKNDLSKAITILPNISLRYGISKRLELRMGEEFFYNKTTDRNRGISSTVSDFLPITIGAKYRINNPENDKWALSALWASRVPVPTKLNIVSQRHYGRFLGQYNLGKNYVFSNIGLDFINDRGNKELFFAYTLGVGRNFAKGFYAFIETFGFEAFNTTFNANGLNAGLIYIINKKYQIDAVFGIDTKTAVKNYHFFTIGFSTYFS